MVSPVTAKMTNFDNEDDLDIFYDAINSDEEEFYDSLEYFEEEESGSNKTSSSQDHSSKNDDKENKAPISPPVSMAPVPIVFVSSEKRKLVLDKDGDQARLVMLDDTTLRPILNLKLFFGIKVRVTDSNCIKIDAFNTVHDIYRRPTVKLMRYSLKFDNFHTASDICDRVNHQIPALPAAIPKKVIHDAVNKDVSSIISRLMRANNPWKL